MISWLRVWTYLLEKRIHLSLYLFAVISSHITGLDRAAGKSGPRNLLKIVRQV